VSAFWQGFVSGLCLGGAIVLWPFSKAARAHVKAFVWGKP
jgi:hypothetical protein